LDVVHLPFVHRTTIGRGNKTLVHGPVAKWNENRLTFYVKNEVDQGQRPEKPSEIENFEKLFHLQLQMPNIWQNIISDQLRIFAAFAPLTKRIRISIFVSIRSLCAFLCCLSSYARLARQ
jgi:phenylpropionate dioxygenase-like ring-hydroxylating dioxygenase large terminal subunit